MVNPSEALLDIFAYFDPTSLVATSLVCRRFSALIRDDARALAVLRKTPTILTDDALTHILWCLDGATRHTAWQTSKRFSEAVDWGRIVYDGYFEFDDAAMERVFNEVSSWFENV